MMLYNHNDFSIPGHSQKRKKSPDFRLKTFDFSGVGMAGFEPAASTSQMWRDTGLRYIPKGNAKVSFKITAANIF